MKRAVLGVLLGALLPVLCSCGSSSSRRMYQNNDLVLVVTYTAKDACSCLFVMERDEEFCRAFVKADAAVANVARLTIDREKKAVETSALLLWGARAHYENAHDGCVLDP